MIYTVESEHGTRLAIAKKNRRGPATITFFPSADLTAKVRMDMAREVRAKLRAFKAKRAPLTAEAPVAIQ